MSERILVVDDSATVRQVALRTLRRAGYEVLSARDGREGLEQAQRHVPDLVLLDQIMPHMDGAAFCTSLRGIANLREVPVVLMSARRDQLEDAQVERTGAVDAIHKPFGPDALLAVTVHALDRRGARASEPDPASSPGSVPAVADDADAGADTAELERRREQAARTIAEQVAERIAPAVRAASSQGPSALAEAMQEHLGTDGLLRLAEQIPALVPKERGETAFEGRLHHVGLGEVLQLLQHQRQTGVLEVEGETQTVVLCLREGLVDIALGRGGKREFLLGRYLLGEGLVEREDLERLLARRGGSRRLLGAQLVKLGYMTSDDLHGALVRQTSELVYEALRWTDGRYRFERFARRPEANEARLGLPIASILMEGLRRVDEWRLIEEQIRSFDQVLAPDSEAIAMAGTDRMSREERAVLSAVDGERTVRDVVEHTGMGSFDVCKVLFQLLTSRLVRERTPGPR